MNMLKLSDIKTHYRLLKYYTSMCQKMQVNLDIPNIFVRFHHFYVNTIMLTI